MSNITKAVHELENQHGPLNDIPESIMIKWRAENRQLISNERDELELLRIAEQANQDERIKRIRIRSAEIIAENDEIKYYLDQHSPAEVVRGSSKDAVRTYSREMAGAIRYIGKRNNRDIARIIGLPVAKVSQTIERIKRNRYHFITVDGKHYEANTIVGLRNEMLKGGYDFAVSGFNTRIKRGGYYSKGKHTVGKFVKQLIIRKLQIIDNDGNVIREV